MDVTLDLESGDRLLLLGPNGAGKSTFIRVFAGLMRATSGHALISGQPAREMRQQVGVVSHTTYLYEELTASENLGLFAALYDVADPARRVVEVLAQVGLSSVVNERVGRLSRGQQQRVTIARALVHDPPLLLLDEPDTGLDVAAFDLLEALITRSSRTVVLTTHNLAAGVRLATRAAILSRGRIEHVQDRVSASDAAGLSSLLQRLAAA